MRGGPNVNLSVAGVLLLDPELSVFQNLGLVAFPSHPLEQLRALGELLGLGELTRALVLQPVDRLRHCGR